MNKYQFLSAAVVLATLVLVQPALAAKNETAPGPEVDDSKLDKAPQSDQKKTDEKTKKPARSTVKILPLKAAKEMAK